MLSQSVFPSRAVLLRKSAGLSMPQLGEALCLTKGAVSNLEHGNKQPSLDTVLAYADYFRVPVSFLLGLKPFDRWETLSPVLPMLRCSVAELLSVSPSVVEAMSLPDFIRLIDAVLAAADYHPDTGVLDLFPILSPGDVRALFHLE